jgi:hypothetical protein
MMMQTKKRDGMFEHSVHHWRWSCKRVRETSNMRRSRGILVRKGILEKRRATGEEEGCWRREACRKLRKLQQVSKDLAEIRHRNVPSHFGR